MPTKFAMLFRCPKMIPVGLICLAMTACPEKQITRPERIQSVSQATTPEDSYNHGVAALKANDLNRALAFFQEALSTTKTPRSMVDAYYNIGVVLLKKHDLDGAQKAFQNALAQKADHRDTLINLGAVLKRKKNYLGAIQHYRRALQIYPRDPIIMNNLIVSYRLNRQYAQAERTGHRLLARVPNNANAYINMALVYADQGKYPLAVRLCMHAKNLLEKQREKGLSIQTDASIHNNLGMIYMRMGKTKKALEHIQKALQIEPNRVDALLNMGSIAHKYRDYPRAISAYKKILAMKSNHAKALRGLAYACYGAGETSQAVELFSKVIQQWPDDAQSVFVMGEIHNDLLHDYSRAIQYYQQYKAKMGSSLNASDPVHSRLKAAQARMKMLELDEHEAPKR